MSRVIWKFDLPNTPLGILGAVNMPQGAVVVHAGLCPSGNYCLWAMCDPESEVAERSFVVVGTGHSLPDGCEHIASVVDGQYVWHFLEYIPKQQTPGPKPRRA